MEKEIRPWGYYEILLEEAHFKSKKITVFPNKRLSYQSHKYRAENWVIVAGEATVVLNDQQFKLMPSDHIFIPRGAKHRICNFSDENLEFIEVQTGSYFGEDDIIRYQDDFQRV
jgi:mannose-1-phosphate guanylyltransferase/mannose-1-phosphate guanylyltransferase/mannose-6-phosphate isomerase